MLCRLICAFVLLCVSSVLCAEPTYGAQQPYTVSVFRQASEQLTINEILTPEYNKYFVSEKSESILSVGSHSITWLKVESGKKVKDKAPSFFIVDNIGINDKESVAMYATYDSGDYIELPRNQEHTFPVFNLYNDRGMSTTYYLKFTNKSNYKLLAPLSFLSAEALQEKLKTEYIVFGGMLFSLLILAAYNIILFAFIKDFSYLATTSVLLSCVLLLNRSSNIIGFISAFKEDTYYFYSLPMAMVVLIIFYFWKKLLVIDEIYPKIGKVIDCFFLVNLVLVPFMGLIPSYEFFIHSQFFVLFFIIPTATFFLATKGIYVAKVLSVLTLVNSLATIPIVFGGLGIIHTGNLVIKLYLFGVVVFGILMSLFQIAHTRQLRKQTELAEAQRDAKDEFLRSISHELRTPMHAVISSGALLLDTPLNNRQQSYIERLNIASAHMLGLIDDLLNLAKIEMTGGQQKNDKIHLPELLHDIDVLLAANAHEKNIELFILDKSGLDEFFLLSDKKSLHQVMINLIYNGIKYTTAGSVTLKITSKNRSAENFSVDVLFEISDTGIGIAKNEQKKLFEPFYRIANKENERQVGSGLGLVITRKLVALLGGNLRLDSSPGAGTRFYFTLPFSLQPYEKEYLTEKDNDENKSSDKLVIDVSKVNILVVDDNDLNRFFTEELLKTEGYQTDGARNGKEALSMLQEYKYDLIFLDLNMPDMSGFEVAQKARRMEHWQTGPIIAFTANAVTDEKERCLAAGMNDCVSKPLPLKALDRVIKKHLSI